MKEYISVLGKFPTAMFPEGPEIILTFCGAKGSPTSTERITLASAEDLVRELEEAFKKLRRRVLDAHSR
jgi:hypothetical protein